MALGDASRWPQTKLVLITYMISGHENVVGKSFFFPTMESQIIGSIVCSMDVYVLYLLNYYVNGLR